jgi:hypothetical protein
MTALADLPMVRTRPRARRGPGSLGPGPAALSDAVLASDRSGTVRDHAKTMRSWPLLVLAVPAAPEVWSGWVGIAQKTGFGQVSPLPGIWPSLHLDTTVTLPVGVEAYAAYALRAWLDTSPAVSDRTRRFARRSAIFSFALGMAGQVAYHLLAQAGAARAPWIITTIVSCLPVLVLAMGTTLAHMLRADAQAARDDGTVRRPAADLVPDPTAADQDGPAHEPERGHLADGAPVPLAHARKLGREHITPARVARKPRTHRQEEQARLIARQLAADGVRVSQRALRGLLR